MRIPVIITGTISRPMLKWTIQNINRKMADTSDVSVTKYLSELIWSRSPNRDDQILLNLCMVNYLFSMCSKYKTKTVTQHFHCLIKGMQQIYLLFVFWRIKHFLIVFCNPVTMKIMSDNYLNNFKIYENNYCINSPNDLPGRKTRL